MGRSRLLAGTAAVLLVGCAAAGLARPQTLLGAAAWAVVVAAVLWGLGGLARRALGVELRIGEQLLVGATAWIAGSGVFLAVGHASRAPLFVLAAVGLAGAVVELARPRPAAAPGGDAGDRRAQLVFLALLALLLALNLLAMVGTRGNPADDEALYTALVKRVLDCGNLIEPFSFRRLSAYGGQTMLQTLAALRGDVAAINLLDLGIFPWIAVLLVIDLAARRKVHFAITTFVIVFLLALWIPEQNSAPTWTAFAFFLGGYLLATRDDLPARPRLILTFAVLGAACTLRQNYLVPAGLFGILLLVAHVREAGWRAAWRTERATLGAALAAVGLVLVPYMIAAIASSGTPLYPLILGTGNPAAPLRPAGSTIFDELQFFLVIAFSSQPIRVWWLLLPAMAIARDRRPHAPWRAYLVACAIGFVVLVHSFMLSDPYDLWRYAFGFLTPLAVAFAIEAAACLPFAPKAERPALEVPPIATALVWIALAVNLVLTQGDSAKRIGHALAGLPAAAHRGTRMLVPGARSYAPLQRAIPAGARVAVLLDDPWLLDYARNPIANLDLPGFAAPGPGLPSFTDPAHWRAYFLGQGIRYLAFVDPRDASYMHRRINWVWRMFDDDPLYQFVSAHMVDTLDTLVQLAGSSHVLFHRDGLYAINLGGGAPPEAPRGAPEAARMDAYARHISEDELHSNAWQLASRSDVVFEHDGTSPTAVVPPPYGEQDSPGHSALSALLGEVQPAPHRWLMERTRIRVHGRGRGHAHVELWVKASVAATTPTVKLELDGEQLAAGVPDAAGKIALDADAACDGWCDLYVVFSSTFEWWVSPERNGLAELDGFTWTEGP